MCRRSSGYAGTRVASPLTCRGFLLQLQVGLEGSLNQLLRNSMAVRMTNSSSFCHFYACDDQSNNCIIRPPEIAGLQGNTKCFCFLALFDFFNSCRRNRRRDERLFLVSDPVYSNMVWGRRSSTSRKKVRLCN
jgi:hypothetical protein